MLLTLYKLDIPNQVINFRENLKEKEKLDAVYGQYLSSVQDDIQEKAANFVYLMTMIKAKIQETDDPRTRIHSLTLAPISWPTNKVQDYFQV